MKVHRDFPHTAPPPGTAYPVVTVGVFDGVHRGHQRILDRLIEVAAGRAAAVVTFDPHPRAVLGPPKTHRLLSLIEERIELLRNWPLAAVVVLRFDDTIANLSYTEFVRGRLMGLLGAAHLVLGFDTRLGHDRAGTPEKLIELGTQAGYAVDRVEAVRLGDTVVSSTAIRHLLDAGDVAAAVPLLGRPYALGGRVVEGAGRGRGLGIPTANLDIAAEKLVPAPGVYAGRAHVAGRMWPAAVNIGSAPTFAAAGAPGAPGARVEAHLLGFSGDLYGQILRVDLVRRLRDERRFPSAEALVAQIRADIEAVGPALAGAESGRGRL